ncbi:carbon-nitrogen hydrolase family protein [Agrobacterium sp. ICMP 6402]|uniref:carbon-nitrogen hydrolase family protein n=1 Tax=Agrobacterium sp. ICMP 6402 TaxID=2292443 RepID=UPI001296663B|nr:carbon-nitrogen hydrolase family protein [Agrobacterium sp. ICMP 6402]MQB12425.1 carbon-nitrogen hydrolase family protein [Agrobacterium sp. ICMP 6402]
MTEDAYVAVAQVPVVLGDVAHNLAAMSGWMEEAAAKGAKLLVFPECYLSGYMFETRDDASASAIERAGPELEQVRLLCKEHAMEVVVGFLERVGSKLHNSAAVVGPHGVTGIHRKRHMPFLGADRFVDEPEGVDVSVFETAVGKVGVAICYEIRFPEVSRTLALSGADFIALPTNWPVQSVLLADYFTRVRAAENFVFFLVANRADSEGDADFLGKSQIIDPLGNVMINAGTDEGIVLAVADVGRARNKTIAFKAGEFELSPWRDRRPATYRLV